MVGFSINSSSLFLILVISSKLTMLLHSFSNVMSSSREVLIFFAVRIICCNAVSILSVLRCNALHVVLLLYSIISLIISCWYWV